MNTCPIIDSIRKLDIPAKTKAIVLALVSKARKLAFFIICLIRRHRGFCETMVLGLIAALLLGQIPTIGNLLAISALMTAAVIGLMRELKDALNQFFAFEMPELA